MNISDIIIIYLACGAPFGVQRLMTAETGSISARSVDILWSTFLWPIEFSKAIYRTYASQALPYVRKHTHGDDIQLSVTLERFECLPGAGDIMPVFELRELLRRYVGLIDAAAQNSLKSPAHELFTGTAHPNSQLANACANRINRNKLVKHRDAARRELLRTVGRMYKVSGIEWVEASFELAAVTQDARLESELQSTFGKARQAAGAAITGEVWNTRTDYQASTN